MNDDYDCDFMKNQKYHYLAVTDPNRAYFRIQGKRLICSKRASYFGNIVDLILQPQ